MKVSVTQHPGLSINARCHLFLEEGGKAGMSGREGLLQAAPSATSPHSAPVSYGGKCSGREVSCQLPAQAQLLCRKLPAISQPDPQDKHKIVCSGAPRGNQHRPTERPPPGTKLGIKSLSTREAKRNPQNRKAPAQPDKHLQAHISLLSL